MSQPSSAKMLTTPQGAAANMSTAPQNDSAALDEVVSKTDFCTSVLNTPELLENILLHLPLKQILLVQRVSKQFHRTIEGSSLIRRALFMQPSTQVNQLWMMDCPPAQEEDNYIILHSRASCMITNIANGLPLGAEAPSALTTFRPVVMNSVLFVQDGPSCPFRRMVFPPAVLIVDIDWMRIKPSSSCLKMLITQQPVRRATLQWYKSRAIGGRPAITKTVTNHSGVTLGDLHTEDTKFAGLGWVLCSVTIDGCITVAQQLLIQIRKDEQYTAPLLQPLQAPGLFPEALTNVLRHLSVDELRLLRAVSHGLFETTGRIIQARENAQRNPYNSLPTPTISPAAEDNKYFAFNEDMRVIGSLPGDVPPSHPDSTFSFTRAYKLNEAAVQQISYPMASETTIRLRSLPASTPAGYLSSQICKPPVYEAHIDYIDEAGQPQINQVWEQGGIETGHLIKAFSGLRRADTDVRLVGVMVPGNEHWAWGKGIGADDDRGLGGKARVCWTNL